MCTEGEQHYVTVFNDASLIDLEGAIHSWLGIGCSDAPLIYFSFGNTDTASLFGKDSPGNSSASRMASRPPTEKHTISITRNQYGALVRAATDFFTHNPLYDLTPDNEGDYNCVTAARYVLQAAGIDYLNNIQTPFGVKHKIKGYISTELIEGLLSARDSFDASAKELILRGLLLHVVLELCPYS